MPDIGHIDDKTAALLIDIIDMHVEGIADARQATMDDPTLSSAEQLLDLMAGYDEDMDLIRSFRRRLA